MQKGRIPEIPNVILEKSGRLYRPATKTRIFICGNIAFRRDITEPMQPPPPTPRKTKTDLNALGQEELPEKTINSINRAKLTIQCLLLANQDDITRDGWFWTGTFADDVTDYGEAVKAWSRFVRVIKKTYPQVKYVCVPEIQEKRAIRYGHRVWHFHAVIWSVNGIGKRDFASAWCKVNGGKHNRDQAQRIRHPDRLSSYVRKYVTKTTLQDVPYGRRAYYSGGEIIWPVVDSWVEGETPPPMPDRHDCSMAYQMENEFCGKINVYQYPIKK